MSVYISRENYLIVVKSYSESGASESQSRRRVENFAEHAIKSSELDGALALSPWLTCVQISVVVKKLLCGNYNLPSRKQYYELHLEVVPSTLRRARLRPISPTHGKLLYESYETNF